MSRLAVCFLLFTACAAAPLARTPDDAADAIRDQIARDPGDPRRGSAMEQLAQVELDRARQSNTILAYKRFLAEFPAGDEAVTARALLEGLRFEEALKQNTILGWEAFLSEHPRGKHEVAARNALGNLEIAAALLSPDLTAVRSVLARFPDNATRGPLVAHEDDLAWAGAAATGTEAIDGYLASHPNGSHRIEADRRKEDNILQEIREAEDLPRAVALARQADAGEGERALVAELRLRQALRMLDLEGIKTLSTATSAEPAVVLVSTRAREALQSLQSRSLSPETKTVITKASPGAGLPKHDAVIAAVNSGDPMLRVAALKQLAEWGSADDAKVILAALQSEYVGVRLQAVETLRSLAGSLKPETWRSLRRTRETELLGKELTAPIWRQIAALRDADGRTTEAVAAWRAVLSEDSGDLAARARVFVLSQSGTDRVATGASARELAREAVSFAENRALPVRAKSQDQQRDKGEIVGVAGNLTILRQICSALDLGNQAASVLGKLASDAPAEEQALITLARTDAEMSLNRIQTRRLELEKALRGEAPKFPPCESDPAAPAIEASRSGRVEAIRKLGQSGDPRLVPFLEGLVWSPSKDVRQAATEAAAALRQMAVK